MERLPRWMVAAEAKAAWCRGPERPHVLGESLGTANGVEEPEQPEQEHLLVVQQAKEAARR